MSFPPSDRISIFVSYCHKDLLPTGAVASSRLEELLKDISYRLGVDATTSDLRLFRDQTGMLVVGDKIDERINQHIEICDLGLIFMSMHYCKSESCEKELMRFRDLGKQFLLIELDEFYTKTDGHRFSQIRPLLDESLSSRFWLDSSPALRLAGAPTPSTASPQSRQEYLDALDKLLEGLASALKGLRTERGKRTVITEVRPITDQMGMPSQFDIVMASTTRSVMAEADRLERAYLDAGMTVLRLDRLGAHIENNQLIEMSKKAHVVVQVLGMLPDDAAPKLRDRRRTIREYRKAKDLRLEVLAWQPDHVEPDDLDPVYAEFLRGIEVHQAGIDEFEAYSKARVLEKRALAESLARVHERHVEVGLDTPLISIDADGADAELRDRIKTALDRHAAVTCIPHDVDEATLSEAVRENDAMVLVYGNHTAGQKRANSHFSFLFKQRRVVWSEKRQRFEIAVGDASPKDATPCPSGRNVHVIRIEEDIDQLAMQAFLAALRAEPAGRLQ